jgi:transposase
LQIPANISLLPLPPRSPELNAQENIWHVHAAKRKRCGGDIWRRVSKL